MIFNLAKLNSDNKFIQNTDEVFKDTPLAQEDFSIEVQRLSRSEKIDVSSKAMDADGKLSAGEYSKQLFINSIVAVDGMTDENGNEITIQDKVRELIWEYAPDVLVEAVKNQIESFNVIEEKKSEPLETDSENTPIGT